MKKVKVLIGVLFLTISIGGGIGVAFADSDINALLTNWFNQKGEESIASIEQAIMSEKDTQKQRLKEELQLEIQASQIKLSDFTKEEASKRVKELQDYAEKLIANLKIDTSGDEQQIKDELDAIVEKAKSDMEKVGSKAGNAPGKEDNKNGETGNDSPSDSSSDNDLPNNSNDHLDPEVSNSDQGIQPL